MIERKSGVLVIKRRPFGAATSRVNNRVGARSFSRSWRGAATSRSPASLCLHRALRAACRSVPRRALSAAGRRDSSETHSLRCANAIYLQYRLHNVLNHNITSHLQLNTNFGFILDLTYYLIIVYCLYTQVYTMLYTFYVLCRYVSIHT